MYQIPGSEHFGNSPWVLVVLMSETKMMSLNVPKIYNNADLIPFQML